ncbi:hypothetical protein [Chryseobacterium polytrichastri]|uniref:Uncharacterized protein n=1 Tax=Chryseobacterium polytrichastri TaxID=1302687 RepID=A0A1M6VSV7_9FLAO|nr:hypothetical protein [Chryseobacterium polytrichastri]SHK84491.1 hypothetical protein SAMN05444267_1008132 [Chryseobacterium polytrichastri]
MMEYTPKLKKLDLKQAKSYLSEQSISFSNKTVLTSSAIILMSLNFLVVNEIDIQGVKVTINGRILIFVLLLINLYYFLQFKLSSEVDNNPAELLPEDYLNMQNEISKIISNGKEVLNKQLSRQEEINEEIKKYGIDSNEATILIRELKSIKDDMVVNVESIKINQKLLEEDIKKELKFSSIVKKYMRLNIAAPNIIYFLGLGSVFLRLIIIISQAFNTQDEPLKYLWNKEKENINIIFDNSEK